MSKAWIDGGGSDAPSNTPYQKLYDYDGSGNLIYEGWAISGAASSAALWAIRKNTFDGSSRITASQWAGGDTAQTNIWDNRVSLSYS